MFRSESSKLRTSAEKERVRGQYQRMSSIACEGHKCAFEAGIVARVDRIDRRSNVRTGCGHVPSYRFRVFMVWVDQKPNAYSIWNKLPHQA